MADRFEETEIKNIDAAGFAEIIAKGLRDITVLDLREPDEVLIHPIEGALNIPFSEIGSRLKEVSAGKSVYVICRTGDFSEEITEILTDRGYDAYNVAGGYNELKKALPGGDRTSSGQTAAAVKAAASADVDKTTYDTSVKVVREKIFIDAKGLRCPGPIVKVADTIRELEEGRTVRVEATEDAFASDIAVWCERTGNKLDLLDVKERLIAAEITKSTSSTQSGRTASEGTIVTESGNDKTFIVFSGDLDKTIASFILANGAAAMGRNVTMFFTFWGLNILRRPRKVRVKKTFVESMFGLVLPRGTRRLGLSRMNMFGAGPKMIRAIMKSKGISSLEQLIEDAKSHGVRIVACQMSMDIMGIHKEELIDGVELGGVATFIGSGEKSDISLFI